jgi:hypothetical protein
MIFTLLCNDQIDNVDGMGNKHEIVEIRDNRMVLAIYVHA